nr:thioesterase family protein [Saccharopolyspora sp. HNM0983]
MGDGSCTASLDPDWSVGDRPHGGYLLAVLARAAELATGESPLAVSAQFLHAPRVGPVLIRTERLKTGRTTAVLRLVLEQRGRACVDATVTTGEFAADEAEWSQVPDMPVNPPTSAIDLGSSEARTFFALSKVCDVRLDPGTAAFLRGEQGPPRLRLWARPQSGFPDALFGLLAGDLTVPVTFNLGRFGWSPTVQLTALLRARPANGWLRLQAESRAVQGSWFDEDVTVVDSMGRLVCQARQLALAPERD